MSDGYHDYDNEPIGGGNPYWRCVHCKRSAPEINGRLEGHAPDCEYRLQKEAAQRRFAPGEPLTDALALAESPKLVADKLRTAGRMAHHCAPGESPEDAALRILAAAVRRFSNEGTQQ